MTLGILGLGRMGMQIARRLHARGFDVVGWNRSPEPRAELHAAGAKTAETIESLLGMLGSPKIVWLMLPAGEVVDEVLFGSDAAEAKLLSTATDARSLASRLTKNDIIIDGGNSFYKDSQRRAARLTERGIHFFDSGTSGGIHGQKNGFSIMVGGSKDVWPTVEPIFQSLAAGEGKNYGLVGLSGAGHFVKMVHNGIEYGMMEAIGEGLAILDASALKLDLAQVAGIWSKGSVVSSWLIDLAKHALETENFDKVVGTIAHTGEGKWTIEVAEQLGVDVRVIEDAFRVREESADPKNQQKFSNKIVALLRKEFGGHRVRYKS